VLKFFSDRHRFFLLTDNTVDHEYNIHNHIAKEYGHQLGSNLNVSSLPCSIGPALSLVHSKARDWQDMHEWLRFALMHQRFLLVQMVK